MTDPIQTPQRDQRAVPARDGCECFCRDQMRCRPFNVYTYIRLVKPTCEASALAPTEPRPISPPIPKGPPLSSPPGANRYFSNDTGAPVSRSPCTHERATEECPRQKPLKNWPLPVSKIAICVLEDSRSSAVRRQARFAGTRATLRLTASLER